MKKRLFVTFLAVMALSIAASEANAQTAYGVSIVRGNPDTRIVDGYSGTWLDYYAGLYYDPEVMGQLYRTDDIENTLSSGRHIGYADIIPAEVYLRTTNFVEGMTYCTYSQHFVWAYFPYPANNWWFDPFRYSLIYTGNPPWGGYPFSYYYVPPRRYLLGATEHCKTIPTPPQPTPTPTLPTPTPTPPPPTPTPTPTPCNPGIGGSCPEPFVSVNVNPTSIKPAGTTGGGTTASVETCVEGVANPSGRQVRLQLVSHLPLNGGHMDLFHTGIRPLGKLATTTGTTGADGCFRTTYSPSHIAGLVRINSTISNTLGIGLILVAVPNLVTLGPGPDHTLVGQRDWHPDNHYGIATTNAALRLIAADYRAEFYPSGNIPENDKVAYNDISLIYGGKFDLGRRWSNTGAHERHREGNIVDVRCCTNPGNIPRTRWHRLVEIFEAHGAHVLDETNNTRTGPHWHLTFPLGSPGVAERTPHMFVEDVFDAILKRESTQEEYEIWLNRITTAKAQGSSELLAAAKIFEKEIFASINYAVMSRTNEEFVADVFWSHVFREPTEVEVEYWVAYLQNLPPAVPPNRRRARLIDEFQLLQEFDEIVLGIVDPVLALQ